MSNITQGKWELINDYTIGTSVNMPQQLVIARVNIESHAYFKEGELIANAKLIASAPELQSALRGMIKAFELIANNPEGWPEYHAAKLALGKSILG